MSDEMPILDEAVEGDEPSALHRANRAFGPIIAGMILDAVDLATFGPFGLMVGLPIGAAVGFWLGKCLALRNREAALCAAAAGVYCTIPGTEFLPLGTLAGAYARFMDTGRRPQRPDPAARPAADATRKAGKGPTTRCFAAIPLPADVRSAIAPLLEPEAADARGVSWVPVENLHITMRFFGEVDDLQLAALRTALRDASAAAPAFELQLGATGQFPPNERPRVYWLGVADPDNGCSAWQARVAPMVDSLGFPPERDAFTPHITLARSRDRAGGDALRAILASGQKPPPIRWRVDEIVLFASRGTPDGVRYEVIESLPLLTAGVN